MFLIQLVAWIPSVWTLTDSQLSPDKPPERHFGADLSSNWRALPWGRGLSPARSQNALGGFHPLWGAHQSNNDEGSLA